MLFDGKINFDQDRAIAYVNRLIKQGRIFEVKAVNKKRSISQNSYLHLILTWYAIEYGERVEYIKQEVFKKQVNKEIFQTEYINEKTGEIRDDWKSTSELNTLEMTTAIERFRNYSAQEAGIYLPSPTDMAAINAIEMEIKKTNNQFY